jgi:hypothetical protein
MQVDMSALRGVGILPLGGTRIQDGMGNIFDVDDAGEQGWNTHHPFD